MLLLTAIFIFFSTWLLIIIIIMGKGQGHTTRKQKQKQTQKTNKGANQQLRLAKRCHPQFPNSST